MKKIFAFLGSFIVFGLLTVDVSLAVQGCITAACPQEPKRGGREYIASYVGGNQCYSCDSNDYAFKQGQECGYGSIVMQKDRYNRGVGLYQCVDIIGSYDEWQVYNPGRLCEGAQEVSGDHIQKYYLKEGEATTVYRSGDNGIRLGGHDACYYYDCDDPDKYELRNGQCLPKGSADKCDVTYQGKKYSLKSGEELPIDILGSDPVVQVLNAGQGNFDSNGIYRCACKGNCRLVKCNNGYTPGKNNRCVKNSGPVQPKTCKQRNANNGPVALACCDVEDVADFVGGKCDCRGQNDFQITSDGRGQCVPKTESNPKNCPDDAHPSGTTCECTNSDMWYNEGRNYCECPDGTNKKGDVCKCTKDHQVLKGGECVWSDEYLSSLKAEIESKYSGVKSVTSTFEVSKWKDAEGNFNTARLASDSIAGVVLGTVGGVVTAHLVKKAQVKQGFEDIQCHIGGQSVAGYGDGFVVGR